MLNYQTVEFIKVVEKNPFIANLNLIMVVISFFFILATCFYLDHSTISGLRKSIFGLNLLISSIVFAINLYALFTPYDSVAKIQVAGLEEMQEERLATINSKKFVKEDRNLYYLAPIRSRSVNNLDQLKYNVEKDFQNDLFNGLYKTKWGANKYERFKTDLFDDGGFLN